ncbi:MAG: aminoacyl-histidine dipeptidase [bacterium]|nr:aminoacyl-histidine dipeptidase [bacterium]MBU1918071.1 aminoacyl-histidine dipeptidase [bacterium]
MSTITELKPNNVWKHFYAICQIPHASKKEEKLVAYMKEFGEGLGLETIVDHVGNVLIRKPATAGNENASGVVLQAHLDMVVQKNSDTEHNFDTDPIQTYIDGDWVKAKGTTLGADNGMGAAAIMAVLESKDLTHGPLEALFTVDEEAGMTGAFELSPDVLQGKMLINTDTEEDELIVGCAGGIDTIITMNYETDHAPENHQAYTVNLTGLKGGHSGMDINIGRGNAAQLLAGLLLKATRDYDLRVASFNAGTVRNAIPREGFATVTVSIEQQGDFHKFVKECEKTIQTQYKETEPAAVITVTGIDKPTVVMSAFLQESLLVAITECPNGVMTVSEELGIVETSTSMGVVNVADGKVEIICLQRSAVDAKRDETAAKVKACFEKVSGANVVHEGAYPGWQPILDSELLLKTKDVYKNLFQREPKVNAVHAGLECALLKKLYPHFECISMGPTIDFPHSPDERVNIASVENFWNLFTETLKKL